MAKLCLKLMLITCFIACIVLTPLDFTQSKGTPCETQRAIRSSALRGHSAGEGRHLQDCEMQSGSVAEWTTMTYAAVLMLGVAIGLLFSPGAAFAKGQALQGLEDRQNPKSLTWLQREQINQQQLPQTLEEYKQNYDTIRARNEELLQKRLKANEEQKQQRLDAENFRRNFFTTQTLEG